MNHQVEANGFTNPMRNAEEEEREAEEDEDEEESNVVMRPRAKRGSATDPQSVYARVYICVYPRQRNPSKPIYFFFH